MFRSRRWLTSRQRRLIVGSLCVEIIAITVFALLARFSADSAASSSLPTSERNTATVATATGLETTCNTSATGETLISAENACSGTPSWRPNLPFGDQSAIQAFTAPVSVNQGGVLHIYVSTSAPSYSFRIYRMGWYQGLGARLVYQSSPMAGIAQPPPTIDPSTRMASASNWHDPAAVAIPSQWVSGVYIVKLISSTGYMRYTTFVVRNDASRAQILFQTSVLTYQAYNTWGGGSLYESQTAPGNSQERAYAVSFDRPYIVNGGLAQFSSYEYNLLRWLERRGYDLTYTTDVDTDLRGQLLLNHRLFLAAGHDEYWSTNMRDHVTQARDKGVSLAFFGADDMYWHVRLQESPLGPDRVVVCYKLASLDPLASSNPSTATVLWRDPPLDQPEAAVLGAMYSGIVVGAAPLVIAPDAQQLLQATSLQIGQRVSGLVGGDYGPSEQDTNSGEFDSLDPTSSPSSVVVLTSSPVRALGDESGTSGQRRAANMIANSTLYVAPSGARVFDAGTFWWGLGLDDMRIDTGAPSGSFGSPDFQRLTANLLTYL